VVSVPPKEATPDQVLEADLDAAEPEPAAEPYAGLSGPEAMKLAHSEYQKGNFDEAERLIAVAENRGEDPRSVASARGYVRAARPATPGGAPSHDGASGAGSPADAAGPNEADPASGGFVVP
jgi:hypothetical protein